MTSFPSKVRHTRTKYGGSSLSSSFPERTLTVPATETLSIQSPMIVLSSPFSEKTNYLLCIKRVTVGKNAHTIQQLRTAYLGAQSLAKRSLGQYQQRKLQFYYHQVTNPAKQYAHLCSFCLL